MSESEISAHRSNPAQTPPPEDLTGFPSRDELVGTPVHRCHQLLETTDKGCWYFSGHPPGTTPGGRFDLEEGAGTCYVAETPEAAVSERCGRFMAEREPIPYDFVSDRVVTEVVVPADAAPVADALAPDASVRFGVTRELFSGHDYDLTSSWAQALYGHRWRSLLYEPRFSTSGYALALFSEIGPQSSRPIGKSTPAIDVLVRMGARVVRPPHLVMAMVDDEAEVEDA